MTARKRTRTELLKAYIAEELADMNNTDYYYAMMDLSEWAQSEADLAEMDWRGTTYQQMDDCGG